MGLAAFIILFLLNFAVYTALLVLIFIKRKHTAIATRSPILLTINNLGGLVMSSIFIMYEMVEEAWENNASMTGKYKTFCIIFPNNYIVFHLMFMMSFVLRCHRIIECVNINRDERSEIDQFYKKRHLFKEKHYLKILVATIILLFLVNLLVSLVIPQYLIVPYHFKKCMTENTNAGFFVSIMWLIVNFIEHIILISYTYMIWIHKLKMLIKFELISFLVVWFIYPNFLRLSDLIFDVDEGSEAHWTSYVCCGFLYICLLINGYLPAFLAYYQESDINYHFNPKLADNFYLFLSTENCFYAFYDYLESLPNKEEALYYLNMYTDIMKFQHIAYIENDLDKVIQTAKRIYNLYFASPRPGIDNQIINKIKSSCQLLDREECYIDMYDEALSYCYSFLIEHFHRYKRNEDYRLLIDNLNLHSYIRCKLSNTGLLS